MPELTDAESYARKVKTFNRWLWFFVFPTLGMLLYFMVNAGYHPHRNVPQPPSFSCASEMASLAPIDGGGQIAPLCGATPYPGDTVPDDGG